MCVWILIHLSPPFDYWTNAGWLVERSKVMGRAWRLLQNLSIKMRNDKLKDRSINLNLNYDLI